MSNFMKNPFSGNRVDQCGSKNGHRHAEGNSSSLFFFEIMRRRVKMMVFAIRLMRIKVIYLLTYSIQRSPS
jgi:hypothetical protein